MLCSVPPPTADVLALKTLPSLGTILMKTLLQAFFSLFSWPYHSSFLNFIVAKIKGSSPMHVYASPRKKSQLLGDDSVLTEFHKRVSCLEMD